MSRLKKVLDEKGFTLIEVMLAVAIMSGLTMVLVEMNKRMVISQKTAESGMEKIDMVAKLRTLLNVTDLCTANFIDPGVVIGDTNLTKFIFNAGVDVSSTADDQFWDSTVSGNTFPGIGGNQYIDNSHDGWEFEGLDIINETFPDPTNPAFLPDSFKSGVATAVFKFKKRQFSSAMGPADFFIRISNYFTAQKISNQWQITGCEGYNAAFTPAIACVDLLGGEFRDRDGDGVLDHCAGIDGFSFNENQYPTQTSVTLGQEAARNLTTGLGNVAIGGYALNTSQFGNYNVGIGYESMQNVTGSRNTAVGYRTNQLEPTMARHDQTAIGYMALNAGGAGGNTAIGSEALRNTTSNSMTAVGYKSLAEVTSGVSNTAVGHESLVNLTTGSTNTAMGRAVGTLLGAGATGNTLMGFEVMGTALGTLSFDVDDNVAIGKRAMTNIGAAGVNENVVLGSEAAMNLNSGTANVAIGFQAMYGAASYSADRNIGIGTHALYSVSSGTRNTVVGPYAGYWLTSGNYNALYGDNAGYQLTSGAGNTLLGMDAGQQLYAGSSYNTFVGHRAGMNIGNAATASYNVAVGYRAGESNYWDDGNILIGNQAGCGSVLLSRGPNEVFLLGNKGDCLADSYSDYLISGTLNKSSANRTLRLDARTIDFYGDGTNASVVNFTSRLNIANNVNLNGEFVLNGPMSQMGGSASSFTGSVFFASNATVQGNLDVNGTFNNPSDIRLKSQIEDLASKVDVEDLMKLEVMRYIKRVPGTDEEILEYGFIAQDVKKYFPELVGEGSFPEDKSKTKYYFLKPMYMIPIVVKYLQKERLRFDHLENRVGELEKEVQDLRAEVSELREMVQALINKEKE